MKSGALKHAGSEQELSRLRERETTDSQDREHLSTREGVRAASYSKKTDQDIQLLTEIFSGVRAPAQTKTEEPSSERGGVSLSRLFATLDKTLSIPQSSSPALLAKRCHAARALLNLIEAEMRRGEDQTCASETALEEQTRQRDAVRAKLAQRNAPSSFVVRLLTVFEDTFLNTQKVMQRDFEKKSEAIRAHEKNIESARAEGRETQRQYEHARESERDLAIRLIMKVRSDTKERVRSTFERALDTQAISQMNAMLLDRFIEPHLAFLEKLDVYTPDEVAEIRTSTMFLLAHAGEGWHRHDQDLEEKERAIRTRLYELIRKRMYEAQGDAWSTGYKNKEAYDALYTFEQNFKKLNIEVEVVMNSCTPDNVYRDILDTVIQDVVTSELSRIDTALSTDRATRDLLEEAHRVEKAVDRKNTVQRKISVDELWGLVRWRPTMDRLIGAGLLSQGVVSQIEARVAYETLHSIKEKDRAHYGMAQNISEIGNLDVVPDLVQTLLKPPSPETRTHLADTLKQLMTQAGEERRSEITVSLAPRDAEIVRIFLDPHSYINRFERNEQSRVSIFARQDKIIAQEHLTRVLESLGTDEETLRNFYFDMTWNYDAELVNERLLSARTEVEDALIKSRFASWDQTHNRLLWELVDMRRGNVPAFYTKILVEGMGFSQEKDEALLQVFDSFIASKTIHSSLFERREILGGLLMLNSVPNGGAIMRELLSRYRGSKEDPRRLRTILKYLQVLHRFGSCELATPSVDQLYALEHEREELDKQRAKLSDKKQKRDVKDRIFTIDLELAKLQGLPGVEESLRNRVVSTVFGELDIAHTMKPRLIEQLDMFIKNGFIDIISSLSSRYRTHAFDRQLLVLKEIVEHVIANDFKQWKYTHEKSDEQLLGLSEVERDQWRINQEPIAVSIGTVSEEERRAQEFQLIRGITQQAIEHMGQERGDIALTPSFLAVIERDRERRVSLEGERAYESIVTCVRLLNELQTCSRETYDKERILTLVPELKDALLHLRAREAAQDIGEMMRIYSVGTLRELVAHEVDDPLSLLKVGIEPQETCQSWRNGSYNECLLAYVADSNKKALVLTDEHGKIITRAIMKLVDQCGLHNGEEGVQKKALLIERPYMVAVHEMVWRLFIRSVLQKARLLGVEVTLGTTYDEHTLSLFKEEAQALGFAMKHEEVRIKLPQSLNEAEYSDLLGGKISDFHKSRDVTVLTFLSHSKKRTSV